MLRIAVLVALLAAAHAAGAASADSAAYDQGGDIAYRRALQPLQLERKVNADRGATTRVRGIANRLLIGARAIDPTAPALPWTINVASDAEPDVLAYPGGRMLVHTGLVASAGLTDEEAGAVIAHVMAHTLLGYDRRRLEAGLKPDDAASPDPNRRALAVAQSASEAVKQRREPAEIEAADRAAMEMLARAAYDPRAAARAWQRLGAAGGPLARRYPVDDARLALLADAAKALVPSSRTRRRRRPRWNGRRPPPASRGPSADAAGCRRTAYPGRVLRR